VTVECVVQAVHRGGMHFSGVIAGHGFDMDYPLAPGAVGQGPKPMEMLLASLAACAGSSVAALLQRGGHHVEGLRVTARGQRRSEHPTVFTGIDVEFALQGHVDTAAVESAIRLAETRVCPVWAMLRSSTPITSSVHMGDPAPAEDARHAVPPAPRRRRTISDVMGTLGFLLAVVSIVVGLVQIARWVGRLFG
jgi:putative redox protein